MTSAFSPAECVRLAADADRAMVAASEVKASAHVVPITAGEPWETAGRLALTLRIRPPG
jgi:hypothetical protein